MSSLRDQLLGLGFKASPKPERKPRPQPGKGGGHPSGTGKNAPSADAHGERTSGKQAPSKSQRPPRKRDDGEMDLAKAYAIRAQAEKAERERLEREKQEAARLRREAQARLDAFLQGITPLNADDAEIARHFEYGGKIKRIHVTAEQLVQLNAGQLGVLQRRGRYLLVPAAVLAEAEAIFPDAVALKVDPETAAEDDPYADPRYQVPDDLIW